MVCDKVCERRCVTKWCVTKMVCDQVVRDRWCVLKMVCDNVACDEAVYDGGCVTKLCERWSVKDGVCVCAKDGV